MNCSNNNGVSPSSDLYNDQDAADAVASGVATETGGATDQMSDLSGLASSEGVRSLSGSAALFAASTNSSVRSIDTLYNETDGKWTITIDFERNNPQRNMTSSFQRVYTVQYLKGGNFQKYYIANGDTANTIKFDIVSASGNMQNPRRKHLLKSLSGSWVATNANQKLMAVAGIYSRSAIDSVTARKHASVFDYTLSLNFAGISIPANNSAGIPALIAGGMTGTLTAGLSITKDGEMTEKNIDKSFSIGFSSRVFTVIINGNTYTADTETGDTQDQQ